MAGKITQQTLDTIKSIPMNDVVKEFGGVELNAAGKACCPMHEEKTPSFTVDKHKNTWHCFGACSDGGGVIKYVQLMMNVEFPEAVKLLAERFSVQIVREDDGTELSAQQRREFAILKSAQEITSDYMARCQSQLFNAPVDSPAHQYVFKDRGLTKDICQRWGIGLASNDNREVLSSMLKKFDRRNMVQAGLCGEDANSGRVYIRFHDRLMFAIRDEKGRDIALAGRIYPGTTTKSPAKYINSPETEAYKKHSVLYGLNECINGDHRRADRFVVTEGYMDVITPHEGGLKNHVACCGTAFTESHLERLRRHTDNIDFIFDGDSAGFHAAWSSLKTVIPSLTAGEDFRIILLPKDEDVDSYIRSKGIEAYSQYIDENAMPLSRFMFEYLRAQERCGDQTPESLARIITQARLIIEQIEDPLMRSLFITELNNRYKDRLSGKIMADDQIDPDAVLAVMKKSAPQMANLAEQLSKRGASVMGTFLISPILLSTTGSEETRAKLASDPNILGEAQQRTFKYVCKVAKSTENGTKRLSSMDVPSLSLFSRFLRAHAEPLTKEERAELVGQFNQHAFSKLSAQPALDTETIADEPPSPSVADCRP